MSYTIYVMIFVLVNVLFVADIIRAMEFKVTQLKIGTSGTILCGHIENDPEVRVVQWYKSRNIDAFVNGNPSLASWANGETGSQPNYQMEDTTFSLVIGNATLEDEGLYQCSVVRGDLLRETNYYTRAVMYALPRKDPEITLDKDLNRVHCTVEHVKPVIYPLLNFDWIPDSTETYEAILNEDRTYTTSVYCALPRTKSASRVECSFSYLHYRGVGSLDLRNITTDMLMEKTATTVSPMGTSVTFAGDGRRTIDQTSCIIVGIFSISGIVTSFIVTIMFINLRKKYHRDVQNFNRAKESEKKMILPAVGMGPEVTA